MRKGELTKTTILDHAVAIASRVGLSGLTIGTLATDLELSKSGLFAHFQSKEALQLQTLETGATRFLEMVIKPSLKAPRGEPRLRALYDRWCEWPTLGRLQGGCLFVQGASEFDDLPGKVRDLLIRLQKDWLDTLAAAARTAVAEGHFKKSVDPEQFAHELYGVMLMFHHASRLLRDPQAAKRARTAFEALLEVRRA
jgi:AcrR family transcriptional regulator